MSITTCKLALCLYCIPLVLCSTGSQASCSDSECLTCVSLTNYLIPMHERGNRGVHCNVNRACNDILTPAHQGNGQFSSRMTTHRSQAHNLLPGRGQTYRPWRKVACKCTAQFRNIGCRAEQQLRRLTAGCNGSSR